MKISLRRTYAAGALAIVAAVGATLPAQAAEELKMITALNPQHDQTTVFMDTFTKKMKEDESVVTVNYLGADEVTPSSKQAAALMRGLVDIIMSPTTYYSNLIPEARLTGISNVSPEEWRKNGGYDLMSKVWAEKGNAVILGWGNYYGYNQFYIWLLNEPKLSKTTGLDLTGAKMRTTPLYTPFFKAMGAITKNIDPAEVYTALERGVVDGLAWPEGGVVSRGWQRFIKYRVGPGFFRSTTFVTMNKDKFDKLSKAGQEQVLAAGLHYERESGPLLKQRADIDNQKVFEAGVKDYTLPPEYAKAYIKTILDANWADAATRDYTVDFETLKSKMYKSGS
tara:strand:+ start:231 stop:1244 length:1014 start_codon:yes stop_codon:yes gene_type:complete